jgi:hypothetical protein
MGSRTSVKRIEQIPYESSGFLFLFLMCTTQTTNESASKVLADVADTF